MRKITVAKKGFKKYSGNAEYICKQIIKECWNGTFFQVSTGHFSIFYMRDFGMCIKALLNLGYKKEAYEETRQQIKKVFWAGTHFRDTPDTVYVAGDANVFPFWFEIFTDKEMKKKAIAMMRENYLDKPFPLKYTSFIPKQFSLFLSFFAKNYEGTSIWMHLGLCYIDVVADIDPVLAKQYLLQYANLIEKYETFLEVFDETGNPYKTPFYVADEGMLWCVKFFVLKKRRIVNLRVVIKQEA